MGRLRLDLHTHLPPSENNRLKALEAEIDYLVWLQHKSDEREVLMANEITLVGEKVQAVATAVAAIEVKIDEMAAVIAGEGANAVVLQGYADSLDASAKKLDELVLKNTTEVVPPPVVEPPVPAPSTVNLGETSNL